MSTNLVRLANHCRDSEIISLALVGFGGVGPLAAEADLCVAVHSKDYALVEFVHLGLLVAALEVVRSQS